MNTLKSEGSTSFNSNNIHTTFFNIFIFAKLLKVGRICGNTSNTYILIINKLICIFFLHFSQVTLKFGFQVELCRVDVELWPWGMDQGQASKRLEISTSSDRVPSHNFGQGHKEFQQMQMQEKDQNVQNKETQQEHDSKSRQCNGHQWSLQAQQWGKEALVEPPRTGRVFMCRSNTESSHPEPEFKLIGRCELREETRVCFTRSNFSPRPPFPSPPPPQPASCWREELWSRGLLSLGAVTQLRVTVPFAGAASALGLKALVVWGQPARCCPAEEVERIKRVHEASERRLPRPVLFASSVSQTKPPLEADTPPRFVFMKQSLKNV